MRGLAYVAVGFCVIAGGPGRAMAATATGDAEPNRSRTVSGIHISTDRSLDFFSRETLLAGLTRHDMTDEEKAIAIWRLVNRRIYHFPRPDDNDPMRVLNVYGYALCGTIQRVMVWLAQGVWGPGGGGAAGMNSRTFEDTASYEIAGGGWLLDSMVRLDGRKPPAGMGHTWCQLYYGGRAAYLDAHAGFFVYTADGKHIASIAELTGDFTLVSDPVRTSDPFMPCDKGRPEFFYRCTGGERGKGLSETRHSMALSVRPGETLTFHFDKLPGGYFKRSRSWQKQWAPAFYVDGPHHRCAGGVERDYRHYGNGEIRYRPDLTKQGFREAMVEMRNLTVRASDARPGLHPEQPGQVAYAVFAFETPYVMVGGEVEADVELPEGTTASLVLISPARRVKPWVVAHAEGGGRQRLRGVMDMDRARYPYGARLRVEMSGGDANAWPALLALDVRIITQLNFATLPRLAPGANRVFWRCAPQPPPGDSQLALEWAWTEAGGRERTDRRLLTADAHAYAVAVGPVDTEPEENPKYMRYLRVSIPD